MVHKIRSQSVRHTTDVVALIYILMSMTKTTRESLRVFDNDPLNITGGHINGSFKLANKTWLRLNIKHKKCIISNYTQFSRNSNTKKLKKQKKIIDAN